MHYGRFWQPLSDTNANTTLARNGIRAVHSEDDKQNQEIGKKNFSTLPE